MKLSLKIAISILFIASILILLVPFLFNWNNYKPQIKEKLFEITGLQIEIDGDIHVQIFPFPGITIENVALRNPEWTDIKIINQSSQEIDQAEFFTVERVNVSAAYAPLLSGQIVFDEIRIIGPQIQFIKDKKGNFNWQSTKIKAMSARGASASTHTASNNVKQSPDNGDVTGIASQQADNNGASSWQDKIAVRAINIQNASMQIIDTQLGRVQALKNANLTVTGELSSLANISAAQNVSYDVSSQLDYAGYRFHLNGDIGLKDWQNKIISLQLNSSLSALDNEDLSIVNKDFLLGQFSGIIDVMSQPELQGDVDVKIASLSRLMQSLPANKDQASAKKADEAMQAISLTGQLKANREKIDISSLKLLVNEQLALESRVNISNILPQQTTENKMKIMANSKLISGFNLANLSADDGVISKNSANNSKIASQKSSSQAEKNDGSGDISALLVKEQDLVIALSNLTLLPDLKDIFDVEYKLEAPQIVYLDNQINDANLSFNINDGKVVSSVKFADIKAQDVKLAGAGRFDISFPVQKNAKKGLFVNYKLDYMPSVDKASCNQNNSAHALCDLSLLRSSGDVFVADDRVKGDGLKIQIDQYVLDNDFAYQISGKTGQIIRSNVENDRKNLDKISSQLTLRGGFKIDDKIKLKQPYKNSSLSDSLGKISALAYDLSIKNPSIFNPASYDVVIDASMHNAHLINRGQVVFDNRNDDLPFGIDYKQGKIQIKSSDLSLIARKMAGLEYNLAGKTDLSADFSLDHKGRGILIDNISGNLADISLSGHAKMAGILPQSKDAKPIVLRPSYDIAFKADKVDLDRYFPKEKLGQAASVKASREANVQNSARGGGAAGLSQQGLDTRFLNAFDAKLNVGVNRIILNGVGFDNLVLLVGVKDGQLKVDTASIKAFDGDVKAGLVVDGQSKLQDPVRIAGKLDVNNVRLKQFVPALARFGLPGTPFVQGDATFGVNFNTIGVSPAALMDGLNGAGKLSGQNVVFNGVDIRGVVKAIEDADSVGQGLALINQSLGKGFTVFDMLSLPFDIKKGVIVIGKDAALQGQDASILFSGNVNLPDSDVDVLSNIVFRNENIPSIQIKSTGPIQDVKNTFSSNVLEDYLKNKLARKLDDILRDKLGDKIPLNGVENLFRALGAGGSQSSQDGSR